MWYTFFNTGVDSKLPFSKMTRIQAQAAPQKDEALKEACEGFEAMFTRKMLESMRQTLPGDGLFAKSNATDILQSMQDQNLAEDLAAAPTGTGLKEFLYNQLKDTLPKSS